MARTREDAFEEVIRKAAEIAFDEGKPKEVFDRIGLRPYINAQNGILDKAEVEELRVERWRLAWKSNH